MGRARPWGASTAVQTGTNQYKPVSKCSSPISLWEGQPWGQVSRRHSAPWGFGFTLDSVYKTQSLVHLLQQESERSLKGAIMGNAPTFSNKKCRSLLPSSSSLASWFLCLSGLPRGPSRPLSTSNYSMLTRISVSLVRLWVPRSHRVRVCPVPCRNPGSQPGAWLGENTWLIFVKRKNKCSCDRCAPGEPILQCLSLLSLMGVGLKLFMGKNAAWPTAI